MVSNVSQVAEQSVSDSVHARRWWVLVTLCASMAVVTMDNTILGVAIPSIIRDLDASNTDVQWIIDAYTLVFAGLLLTMGSLSDRLGRKGTMQTGLVFFAISSVVCALAQSSNQLIIARALMGVGGAMIMPATLSILSNVFRDPRERARAIGVWAGVSALGAAIGPILGGLLLEHFSWGSVFWINVPIAAVALVVGALIVPTSRDPEHGRLDPFGSLLSIVGLTALLFGIIEGPVRGWSDSVVLGAFALGAVVFVTFVWWETTTEYPMLDVRVFANPRFSAASSAITLTFFAMFGAMFLMAQYWQFVHDYTPLQTAVRLLPFPGVLMVMASLSPRLVERLGTKLVMTAGLLLVVMGLALLSLIHRDSSYLPVISAYCLIGTGMGMTMAPATESIMGSLPPERAGVGSAVNDTTRQVGGALGVGIIGSVVASVFASRIGDLAERFGLSSAQTADAQGSIGGALEVAGGLGSAAQSFAHAAEDSFVGAVSIGMRIAAIIVLATAAIVWRYLPARASYDRRHVDVDLAQPEREESLSTPSSTCPT